MLTNLNLEKINIYWQLLRMHQPTGFILIMWPGLCSIILASNKKIDYFIMMIFIMASIVIRSAGCIINDLMDVEFDKQVFRTKTRPLPSGKISKKAAILLLIILLFISLLLALQLNFLTLKIAVLSIIPIIIYPLMKRITYWPQLFLAFTFNLGSIMGWTAIQGRISTTTICLYLAFIFWTLGYDTIYAYQDIKDDQIIGVKSTAIKFGDNGKKWLVFFYSGFLLMILLVAKLSKLAEYFYLFYCLIAIHITWQICSFRAEDPNQCMVLFKSNLFLGAILFLSFLFGK